MDRMSTLDSSFLYLENGTTHLHIASCALFAGPAPDFGELVRLFEGKLPLVPRYRQRVRFVPMDLSRPVWVDDAGFDLANHLRHTALPAPGGELELRQLMGRLMGQALDRRRPLWEAWMVEGLSDDRWAIISKVHHCMIDGVAGVDLISLVLDATPEPSKAPPEAWEPEPERSTLRLVADAAADLIGSPGAQLRAVRAAVRAPTRALAGGRTVAAGLRSYATALRSTPPTSLVGPIGAHRRWTCARASLEDIKVVRKVLGGTVNDVVLAAIASGFRDLAVARGEDPSTLALRTLVPVSMRREDEHGLTDNRVSAIFFDLPVQVDDPLARLSAVRAEMGRLKESHEADAGAALTAMAGAIPPAVTALTMRLASRVLTRVSQRGVNTVTTNVPGPPFPLYAAGCEMLEYLPFVPIAPGVRIGVAILSYNGRVAFGITGDFDTTSDADLDLVARGIESEIARLLKAATEPSAVIDLREESMV